MATSVLNKNTNLGEDHRNKYHQKQPIRRSSGKREPKVKKNKQPQRGMGVEKLEQLRIAEGWKKITEIPTTNPNPCFMGPYPFLNGALNVGGIEQMDLNPNRYLGNFEMDLSGSSSVSTITELSSTPKSLKCCNKKKRFNGENVGPFLGLNIGSDNKNVFFKRENYKGSEVKLPLMYQVGYAAAVPAYHPAVEVLAVHKKRSLISSEEVMEYEFFPSGRKDFRNDHEFVMMKKMSDPEASGSCVTDASSPIDLLLKL